jgi:hypothetical protein
MLAKHRCWSTCNAMQTITVIITSFSTRSPVHIATCHLGAIQTTGRNPETVHPANFILSDSCGTAMQPET